MAEEAAHPAEEHETREGNEPEDGDPRLGLRRAGGDPLRPHHRQDRRHLPGEHATMIQSFGPEARGSACSAQVVLSDETVLYPYIQRPSILIAMSQDACDKFAPQMAPGGLHPRRIRPGAARTLPPGSGSSGSRRRGSRRRSAGRWS